MKDYVIGIDIGGTKCAVVLGEAGEADEDCRIFDRVCFATEARRGPDCVIHDLFGAVRALLGRNDIQTERLQAIGISCGGPLDHIKGVVKNPPNLYGWDNMPIVDIMEKEFRVPTYIQNDANACALAEWKFGAARGCRHVIFLTYGTGMGAGLILDGKLYNGANNMAGEVGHVRMTESGPV